MSQVTSLSTSAAPTSELLAALGPLLARGSTPAPRVVGLRRRPSEYRSSFALEEIEVLLEGHAPLQLVFKDLSWRALSADGRRAKPAFLFHPMREVVVYRNILSCVGIGGPRYYGSVVDPDRDRYWLFLEKCPGVELYQVGDWDVWQEAARWLARMHHSMQRATGCETWSGGGVLVPYDADFYRNWMHRAVAFSSRFDHTESARCLRWLAGRYDRVVDFLASLPRTFVHGEYFPSNILVEPAVHPPRICPVDWEMAGSGPGLIDLAALVMGKWSLDQQRCLALAYHTEAHPAETASQSAASETNGFLERLNYCRLHVAVQRLGWSPDWAPPASQAHDWLGEAMRMAEVLHL